MTLIIILYILTNLIALFTIHVSKKKFGTYLNHYTLYNLGWLILLCLSIFLNSYNQPVKDEVYFVFLFGLIAFNSTIIFVQKKKSYTIRIVYADIKWRRLLEIVTIISLLPQAYTNYSLIQLGVELWKLNSDYWNEIRGNGSYLYQTYQQLILYPMAVLLIGTSFYNRYLSNYKNTYIINILIATFIAILYLLSTGGGRSEMMLLFYTIMLSYFVSQSRILNQCVYQPSKFFYILLGITALVLIQWANEGRGKSGDFFQNAINGQVIFAPLFEYYYSNTSLFQENTYGASMFEFFVTLLQYPFRILFGISFYDVYNNEIAQKFIYLPTLGKEVNAGVSAFFYYMRDFGHLGIVIGPMITAALYNWLFSICKRNTFTLFYFFCIVLKSCFSTGYPFNKVFWIGLIMAFIYSRFLTNKQQNDNVSINRYSRI